MKFHHFAIEVENLPESIQFYTSTFGYKIESQFTFLDENIAFLTLDDFRLELISSHEKGQQAHIAYEVANILDTIKEFTLPIEEGPYKLQNGWITVFYKGPKGEIIELIQIN